MTRTLMRSSKDFLLTFTAAYNANRSSVVVRATRPARQLLAIMEGFGLVHSYGTPQDSLERQLSPGVARKRAHQYLLVWFTPQASTITAANGYHHSGVQGWSEHLTRHRPVLRLRLLRQPSRRSLAYLPSQQLRHRRSLNCLQLMATTQGILSSEEARQRRLGGQPLAVLEL
jgi:ribosomal protein S8